MPRRKIFSKIFNNGEIRIHLIIVDGQPSQRFFNIDLIRLS